MKEQLTRTKEGFINSSLPFAINDLPNNEYHNGEVYKEFCSSSVLKLLQVSPKYAKYRLDNPKELESAAISQGSVYHSMLASLANFGDLSGFDKEYFVFSPPVNPGTKKAYGFDSQKYQDALELAQSEADGREACSENEKKLTESMIDELLHGNPHLSPQVNQLLKIGRAEQSHFLEYQGQKFKYRTDLKTSNKIIDWKKTKHLAPKQDKFSKEIINYGYDISAAFYQFFEHEFTGKWKSFFWITQESEPPFDFTILSADNFAFAVDRDQIVEPGIGALSLSKLIDQWCLCCESNIWHGYSIFIQPDDWKKRIGFPQVPGYYKQQDFEFYN